MARKQQWTKKDSKVQELLGQTFLYAFAIPPLDDVAVIMWGLTIVAEMISKPMQKIQRALDNKEGEIIWKELGEAARASRKARFEFFAKREQARANTRSPATRSVSEDLAKAKAFATKKENAVMSKDSFIRLTRYTMNSGIFNGVEGGVRGSFGTEQDLRDALDLKYEQLVGLIGSRLTDEILFESRPQDLSVTAMRDILSIMDNGISSTSVGVNEDGDAVFTTVGAAALGSIRAIFADEKGYSRGWVQSIDLHKISPVSEDWLRLAFDVASEKNIQQMRTEAADLIVSPNGPALATPNIGRSL